MNTPEPEDNGKPLGHDDMFWSWEVSRHPHKQIRLQVIQNCRTHWMLWETLQTSEGNTHPMGKSSFIDRYGRTWSIQAMYFTTRQLMINYLSYNRTAEEWWATAVINYTIGANGFRRTNDLGL